jgi:hypothetical protein
MDANRPPWSMNELVRARSERGTGEVPPQLLSPESSRSVVVPTGSAQEQTPQITSASPLGEDHVRLALNTEVLTSVPATPDVLRRFNGRLVDPSICEAHLFNGDNRTEYWPSGYPWHAVGKLFVWADAANPTHSWIATGALVGRNVVLTASHAFPWNSPNWGIKFVPAFYDSASILGTSVSSWVGSARGYQEHARSSTTPKAVRSRSSTRAMRRTACPEIRSSGGGTDLLTSSVRIPAWKRRRFSPAGRASRPGGPHSSRSSHGHSGTGEPMPVDGVAVPPPRG